MYIGLTFQEHAIISRRLTVLWKRSKIKLSFLEDVNWIILIPLNVLPYISKPNYFVCLNNGMADLKMASIFGPK
jgi:hypothetical protein